MLVGCIALPPERSDTPIPDREIVFVSEGKTGLIVSSSKLEDALQRGLGPKGPGSIGQLHWLESTYASLRGSP